MSWDSCGAGIGWKDVALGCDLVVWLVRVEQSVAEKTTSLIDRLTVWYGVQLAVLRQQDSMA